jgi:hypothetical protein
MDWFVGAALVLVLAGCGGGGGGSASAGNAKLDFNKTRTMSMIYRQYLQSHNDQPPADEKAFRAYVATRQADLEHVGLTIDAMFKSPRSDEPLIWVYGKAPVSSGELGQCFAYEKTAADGQRLVIADAGRYGLMDDAKFNSLFPNTK